jgi:Tn3 transposase DDE domain
VRYAATPATSPHSPARCSTSGGPRRQSTCWTTATTSRSRRILTQLNRGESRHALARDVCHGYRGELRQRYRQGQEEQLAALGLIVNAIVLYNTIYTQRALDHLAATGLQLDDVEVERLSPLGSDHLTLTGRYRIALAEALRDRSAYRELNATPAVAA